MVKPPTTLTRRNIFRASAGLAVAAAATPLLTPAAAQADGARQAGEAGSAAGAQETDQRGSRACSPPEAAGPGGRTAAERVLSDLQPRLPLAAGPTIDPFRRPATLDALADIRQNCHITCRAAVLGRLMAASACRAPQSCAKTGLNDPN